MLKKLVVTPTEKIFYFSNTPAVITDRYHIGGLYPQERNIILNGDKKELNQRVTVYTAPLSGCSKYENTAHCISIANTLECIADGLYYICPECGELCEYEENGLGIYKCDCGCVTEYEPEPASFWDYFNDYYNIEYRVSGPNADSVNSVEVMVACGGPNIYIDTSDCKVKLYWWGGYAEAEFSMETAGQIDDYFYEVWSCR